MAYAPRILLHLVAELQFDRELVMDVRRSGRPKIFITETTYRQIGILLKLKMEIYAYHFVQPSPAPW